MTIEQLAFLNLPALSEVATLQKPLDPRANRNVGGTARLAYKILGDDSVALDDLDHLDLSGRDRWRLSALQALRMATLASSHSLDQALSVRCAWHIESAS